MEKAKSAKGKMSAKGKRQPPEPSFEEWQAQQSFPGEGVAPPPWVRQSPSPPPPTHQPSAEYMRHWAQESYVPVGMTPEEHAQAYPREERAAYDDQLTGAREGYGVVNGTYVPDPRMPIAPNDTSPEALPFWASRYYSEDPAESAAMSLAYKEYLSRWKQNEMAPQADEQAAWNYIFDPEGKYAGGVPREKIVANVPQNSRKR